MPPLRLQKILAQAGVASRRKAEEMIAQGRVRVDGRIVTELGVKAEASAKVELDGKRLVRAPLCYGILHKPKGMLTTLFDPEGRPTLGQILERVGLRVVPVGRLDFNTSGALLFTNDGDFAATMAHARSKVPKLYRAKVQGELDESQLARWAERIEIDGRKTEPANVHLLRRERGHTWLEITLYEGRNRQVRRLGDHAGSSVVRLTRVSQAGITIDGLNPGEYRLLTLDELKTLKASFGQPQKVRGAVLNLAELPGYDPRPSRPRRPARLGAEPMDSPSEGRRASGAKRAGSRAEPRGQSDGDGPYASRAREPESRSGRLSAARPKGARSKGTRPSGARTAGTRQADPRPVASRPERPGQSVARSEAARPSRQSGLANREGARRAEKRADRESAATRGSSGERGQVLARGPRAKRSTVTAARRSDARPPKPETKRSGHGSAFDRRPKKPR